MAHVFGREMNFQLMYDISSRSTQLQKYRYYNLYEKRDHSQSIASANGNIIPFAIKGWSNNNSLNLFMFFSSLITIHIKHANYR